MVMKIKRNLSNIGKIFCSHVPAILLLPLALYLFAFKINPVCDHENPLVCLNRVIFKNIQKWILYLFLTSTFLIIIGIRSLRGK